MHRQADGQTHSTYSQRQRTRTDRRTDRDKDRKTYYTWTDKGTRTGRQTCTDRLKDMDRHADGQTIWTDRKIIHGQTKGQGQADRHGQKDGQTIQTCTDR